jgi:hypothetical protein
MTAPAARPRHALLPDLERSRAVLVRCHDDSSVFGSKQAALRDEIAERLVSGPGRAFDQASTETLANGEDPAEVIDAVRRAAEAASDVLLLYYAGSGERHKEFFFGREGPGPKRPADPLGGLQTVADILRDSRAARLVVLLDCDYVFTAVSLFARMTLPGEFRSLSLLATHEPKYWSDGGRFGDEFTSTLVEGLSDGVEDGPEALDLVTLRNAIEASFTEIRYYIENEYVDAPSKLHLHGGHDVALGLNPAFRPVGGSAEPWRPRRGLPLNSQIVDERES